MLTMNGGSELNAAGALLSAGQPGMAQSGTGNSASIGGRPGASSGGTSSAGTSTAAGSGSTSAGSVSTDAGTTGDAGSTEAGGPSGGLGGTGGSAGQETSAGGPSGGAGIAGNSSYMPDPACKAGVAKGSACTPASPQLCYKGCGPDNVGYKPLTCQSGVYDEPQEGCTFPSQQDYSCYKLPTSLPPACPTGVPRGGQPCQVAACTVCFGGGLAAPQYQDSTGMQKQGYCVCSSVGSWTCGSNNGSWPCSSAGPGPGPGPGSLPGCH